jgi:hypothetical protein
MDQKQFDELNKKLDLISRLLSLNLVKDVRNLTSKVEILSSCGFQPKEIAILLDKEPNHIHQILHNLKTKKTSPVKEELESKEEEEPRE